jgi:hypothetical protein
VQSSGGGIVLTDKRQAPSPLPVVVAHSINLKIEIMERLSDSTPTARKEHKCNFCGGIIGVGEKYERQTNKHDGDIYTWKSHFKCSLIASELRMFDECDEGLTDEDFYESITNEYSNIMSKEFAELYESKGFIIPDFLGQLDFVCKHYKI